LASSIAEEDSAEASEAASEDAAEPLSSLPPQAARLNTAKIITRNDKTDLNIVVMIFSL